MRDDANDVVMILTLGIVGLAISGVIHTLGIPFYYTVWFVVPLPILGYRWLAKYLDKKMQEDWARYEPRETLELPRIGDVDRLDDGWTREVGIEGMEGGVHYVSVHVDAPMGTTTQPGELPDKRQQEILRKLPALYPELLSASLDTLTSFFEEHPGGNTLDTIGRVPLSVEISAADRAQEHDLILSFASEVDDMGYSVVFKDGKVLFVDAGD